MNTTIETGPAEDATLATTASGDDRLRGRKLAVEAAVRGWAQAWAERDLGAYFSSYGGLFRPPSDIGLGEWKSRRSAIIQAASWIDVDIGGLWIELKAPGRARAQFTQSYRSDTYEDRVCKVLELDDMGDRWLIVKERELTSGRCAVQPASSP